MFVKTIKEQSGRSRTFTHILILLTIALGIGIYLIFTTVLISKDGITFTEFAKDIELSPIAAMKSKYQHPGYPFMIMTMHKIVSVGFDGLSLYVWIYSAQVTALMCRLISVILLYFAGRKIVGARFSFWAILILIVLPEPAKLGSDALSDWPHLLFLSCGFLFLILGAVNRKWWLFGFSGLAAGIGYLIRPECVQIMIFATLWLGLQLFWSQRTMSRGKVIFAFALLLVGFFVAAGPYMKFKGALFPKKQLVQSMLESGCSGVYEQRLQTRSNYIYESSLTPSDIASALGKLIERVSETLMWFFVPALLIGLYKFFRARDWREPEKFFVITLIFLNVAIMILLYCKFGYMSRRHTLPLVVFTIFYIPGGLEVLARWLDKRFSDKSNVNFWFLVLMVTGISICSPKLFRPMRMEKQSYREAAQWLSENTDKGDVVAVSDLRISFYAERRGMKYDGRIMTGEAKYAAKIFRDKEDMAAEEGVLNGEEVFSIESGSGKPNIVIYKRVLSMTD